jgi:hypothetical protein
VGLSIFKRAKKGGVNGVVGSRCAIGGNDQSLFVSEFCHWHHSKYQCFIEQDITGYTLYFLLFLD